MSNVLNFPDLGFGLGLRVCHYKDVMAALSDDTKPLPNWFEVISENYMDDHGYGRSVLHRIAERFAVVFHGVSLSIGSSDPLDQHYLKRLKALADEIQPRWISDHLCWTGVGGVNSHDLLPMPLNQRALDHLVPRIHAVQEYLGRPLVLENPSSYIHYNESDIPEYEFLNMLGQATGCGFLIDVNNVFVSAFNLGFDAREYIRGIDHSRVVQTHLAGPTHCGTHLIDTHNKPVMDSVWALYAELQQLTGGISTLLEWDADIPPFEQLLAELDKARTLRAGGPVPSFSMQEGMSGAAAQTALSTPLDFMLEAAL